MRLNLSFDSVTGGKIESVIGDLARLRIAVFREYPYLYEGSMQYEADYLRAFGASRDAIAVTAMDGSVIVGCSTGSALLAQDEALVSPVREAGFDACCVFYCGESVLLPEYRGRGAGHEFFNRREAHAAARGYGMMAFAAVVRERDREPPNYRSLEPFWVQRGYRKSVGVAGSLTWKEIGDDVETQHAMQFWLRPLTP